MSEREEKERQRIAALEAARLRQEELDRLKRVAEIEAKARDDAVAAAAAAEVARNSYHTVGNWSGVWGRLGAYPRNGNVSGHTYLGDPTSAEECKRFCTNNKNCDGFSYHTGHPGSWQGSCYSTSAGLVNSLNKYDTGIVSMIKQNKAPIIGRSWELTINSTSNYFNLTTQDNITIMHFSPRNWFIVLNSYNGAWGREEYIVYNWGFPNNAIITITNAGVEIQVNNCNSYTFAHRYDINTFDHIETNMIIRDRL